MCHFYISTEMLIISNILVCIEKGCTVWRVQTNGFFLQTGAFGTLGVGGGFALGAKLCRPESEVKYRLTHLKALSINSMLCLMGELFLCMWLRFGSCTAMAP